MVNPSDKNPNLGKWLVAGVVSLAVLAAPAGAFWPGTSGGNNAQTPDPTRDEPVARARDVQTPSPYVVIKPSDSSPNPAASEVVQTVQAALVLTPTIVQAQAPAQTPVPAQSSVPTQAVGV